VEDREKMNWKMGLRSKLFVVIVLLAFVPLTVLGLFYYQNIKEEMISSKEQGLLSLVNIIKPELDFYTQHHLQLIEILTEMPQVMSLAEGFGKEEGLEKAKEQFRALIAAYLEGDIDTVFLAHPVTGEVLASSRPYLEGMFFDKRPYFSLGKKGPLIYRVHYSLFLEKNIMALASPVKKDGRLLGVLVGWANIDKLQDVLSFAANTDCYLVNKANLHVISSGPGGNEHKIRSGIFTEGAVRALEGLSGSGIYKNAEGVDVVGAYGPVESLDLALLAEIPLDYILKNARLMETRILIIAFVLATISFAVTAVVGGRITRPIIDLTGAIRKIGTGEEEEEIRIPQGSTEVEELTTAFNQMIERRRTAERKLKESETMLRNLFSSIREVIFVADDDRNIINANQPSLREVFGYELDDVVGKRTSILYVDVEAFRLAGQKIFEDYEPSVGYLMEVDLRRKNGEIFKAELHALKLFNETGEVIGNICVIRDITKRKQAEEALRTSHEMFRKVMDSLDAIVYVARMDTYEILFANKYTRNIFGEITGRLCWETLQGGQEGPCEFCSNKYLVDREGNPTGVYVWEFQNTVTGRWFDMRDRAMQWMDGSIVRLQIATDITGRKLAEEQIRKSLKEKEVLLKEIHNRVKNNMSIVSTLLRLQSRLIKDEESLGIFRESQNRIKSMALIHERLYQSDDFSRIDFRGYVEGLTRDVFDSYGIAGDEIMLAMDIEDVSMDINTLIPCGLIINEFLTNSIVHAFEGVEGPEIRIGLRLDGLRGVMLVFGDNGRGLPGDTDFGSAGSLGLQLVDTLVKQLKATLELDVTAGTTYRISFTMPLKEEA
jgi:PAS domain S-box-containing protein